MTTASILTRGQTVTRAVIAKALAQGSESFARHRWGDYHATQVKAAVSAITSGDTGSDVRDFMGLVKENSILNLPGFRKIPFRIRMLALTSGATGYWVAESKPIPLSKPVLAGSTLDPLKVASIIAATKESVTEGGPIAEAGFQNDLVRALAASLDMAFLDRDNAGVANERPASVTFGAPDVVATADPTNDLLALIEQFAGDLAQAFFVTDAYTATRLGTYRDTAGSFLFPDAGPRGGSVLGIPLYISRTSPRDSSGGQIALVDPSGIALGLDGIEITLSEQGTLAMSDSPEAEPELVSLWQTNTLAWKALITANWKVERQGSVAVLTGVTY